MALVLIDHSGFDAKPLTEWGRHEFEACLCEHCETLIAFIRRGCNTFAVSGSDMRKATFHAHELPATYTHKYQCRYCSKNICRNCFAAVERTLVCPGPFRDQMRRRSDGAPVGGHAFHYRAVVLGASLPAVSSAPALIGV